MFNFKLSDKSFEFEDSDLRPFTGGSKEYERQQIVKKPSAGC